jgi:hypothetical protein
VWSDTSYAVDTRAAALSLSDVLEGSRNLHRELVRTGDGGAGALHLVYREEGDGNGTAVVRSNGFRVTLAADPILAMLAMVSESYAPPEGDAAAALDAGGGGGGAGGEEAQEMYSWWMDTTLNVRGELGPCMVEVLQNCRRVPTAALRLGWSATCTFVASRVAEEGLLEVSGVELYTVAPEQSLEPLYLLEKSSATTTVRRTYEGGRCASQWRVAARALDFLVTYQDIKVLYWMYKAHERAVKASGLVESRGVRALLASLPGVVAAEAAAAAAAATGSAAGSAATPRSVGAPEACTTSLQVRGWTHARTHASCPYVIWVCKG